MVESNASAGVVRGKTYISELFFFRTKGRCIFCWVEIACFVLIQRVTPHQRVTLVAITARSSLWLAGFQDSMHRANHSEPTRGEAPPCNSIVRNEMEGYDTGEPPMILANKRLKCDSGCQRHRMLIANRKGDGFDSCGVAFFVSGCFSIHIQTLWV